eukprot:COSAG01_NODE_1689_length_9488_cov_5.759825_14_plen_38_part_00
MAESRAARVVHEAAAVRWISSSLEVRKDKILQNTNVI